MRKYCYHIQQPILILQTKILSYECLRKGKHYLKEQIRVSLKFYHVARL